MGAFVNTSAGLLDENQFAVLSAVYDPTTGRNFPTVTPPASVFQPGGNMGTGFVAPVTNYFQPLEVLPDGGIQEPDGSVGYFVGQPSSSATSIAQTIASLGTTVANVVNSLKNNTPLYGYAQPVGTFAKPAVSQTAMPLLLIGGAILAAFLIFRK